jgi:uncharacterized surface protein with fasciclin (FAS1) repeats
MNWRWIVCAAAVASVACAKSHQLTDTSNTVLALASSNPTLATFITMAETSGLSTQLRGSEPVTILAPNNDALNTLGAERVRFLLSDEGANELSALLDMHVFPGAYSAEDVARGKLPRNAADRRIAASKASDGTPRVETSGKILESMRGSNGFVHVIDIVIR